MSANATFLRYGSVRHALGLDGRTPIERLARATVAATVAGCGLLVLVNFVIAPLLGHFSGQFEDFGPLLYAGRAAGNGGDIYGAFVPAAQSSLVTNLGFDYLPVVAVLARPLTALPHNVAVIAWLWIILGCTIAGSIIIARDTLPANWPRTAIGFCVAVLFAPAIYNVWHGQMNAVVFLSLAVALRAWIRGDEVTCGVALGLGGVAKVAPAVLLLLLLRRGWWRGALAGAATVAAALVTGGVLLGFDRLHEWFTRVLPVLGRADGWFFNESANGIVNRLANHNVVRLDAPNIALQFTVTIVAVAILLGAVAVVRHGVATAERRQLEFSAAVAAMLLAGGITWYSAYGALALPLMVVAGLAARRHVNRRVIGAAAVIGVVAGVAAPIFLAAGGESWVIGSRGTVWWWPALQVDSIPAYALTLLFVALLVTLARGRARERPGSISGERLRRAAA